MASIYHFFDDAVHVQNDIVNKYKEQASTGKRNHFAATKIQRYFRGYIVRKKIKNLHSAATVIQKYVRGWLVRYHLPDILHEYYDLKCLKHYNEMATRIQARWKGYKVRKDELCIKDVLEERAQMLIANEQMRKTFSLHNSVGNAGTVGTFDIDNEEVFVKKILTQLFDRHHLLRTRQKEGVFSKHAKDELSELEKFLQCIPWTGYMKKLRKIYHVCADQIQEYKYMFDDKKLRREEDLLRSQETPLVERNEVIEEKNLHEKPFVFATKINRKPYERLISNDGKYTVVETKVLRNIDKGKNISEKDFNLYTLKQVVNSSDVPPYYIDFWLKKCQEHNL